MGGQVHHISSMIGGISNNRKRQSFFGNLTFRNVKLYCNQGKTPLLILTTPLVNTHVFYKQAHLFTLCTIQSHLNKESSDESYQSVCEPQVATLALFSIQVY